MAVTLRNSFLTLVAGTLLFAVPRASKAEGLGLGAKVAPIDVTEPGTAIHLDNDLFAAGGDDRDYSWGATVTFGSPEPGRVFAPLDRVRGSLASLVPGRAASAVSRASQVGIIAMTPDDLMAREALPDDRPYANLAYLTSSELRIDEAGDRSQFTSFTLGILGTGLAEGMQRAVHEVQGGVVPNGWSHQISDGGEPTARFVLAEQWLLGDTETAAGDLRQVKLTVAGSAGFLTEGSAEISMRWGRIQTPWWSFNPELGDYSTAPVAPVNGYSLGSPEIYGFVGARLKVRAYNALLQGQFRHSDVRVASDDLERLQAEVWAGFTAAFSELQMTYAVHAVSREISSGPGARSLVWASVSLTRAF